MKACPGTHTIHMNQIWSIRSPLEVPTNPRNKPVNQMLSFPPSQIHMKAYPGNHMVQMNKFDTFGLRWRFQATQTKLHHMKQIWKPHLVALHADNIYYLWTCKSVQRQACLGSQRQRRTLPIISEFPTQSDKEINKHQHGWWMNWKTSSDLRRSLKCQTSHSESKWTVEHAFVQEAMFTPTDAIFALRSLPG